MRPTPGMNADQGFHIAWMGDTLPLIRRRTYSLGCSCTASALRLDTKIWVADASLHVFPTYDRIEVEPMASHVETSAIEHSISKPTPPMRPGRMSILAKVPAVAWPITFGAKLNGGNHMHLSEADEARYWASIRLVIFCLRCRYWYQFHHIFLNKAVVASITCHGTWLSAEKTLIEFKPGHIFLNSAGCVLPESSLASSSLPYL